MKEKHIKEPLVSFCLATYKRPDFLKKTLLSIINQTYSNIEIIVTDNDPEGSAKKIIDSIKSKKIKYYKNKNNLGVVHNFNKAFVKSKGEFITFISDDDPIEPFMTEDLIKLYRKYPNYDSFYGAAALLIEDQSVAKKYHLKKGKNPMRNITLKEGAITLLSPENFLKSFINHDVLPYFWWSTGITRRNLIKKIGMMPEYNSLFFTDFALICLIGTNGKIAVTNKVLGYQTVHKFNSLRLKSDLEKLGIGIQGFYKLISPYAKSANLEIDFQEFISTWVTEHLLSIKRLTKGSSHRIDNAFFIKLHRQLGNNYKYIRRHRLFILKLVTPYPLHFIYSVHNIFSGKTIYKIFKYIINEI